MAGKDDNKFFYENQLTSFVDVHNHCCVMLEQILAKVLMNGDLKRIQYSSAKYMFRERLTNTVGEVQNADKNIFNLHLPFTSYMRTGEFEDDPRPARKSWALASVGTYFPEIGGHLRYNAVKTTFEATAVYDSQFDLRRALFLIRQESAPAQFIHTYMQIYLNGHPLRIPILFKISKIDSNPSYEYSDFLEKQKIFPLKLTIDCYTYQIICPYNNVVTLPFRLADRFADIPSKIYLTEKCVLDFANAKFGFNTDESKVDINAEAIQNVKSTLDDLTVDEENKYRIVCNIPTQHTVDVLSGYFMEDTNAVFNILQYSAKKSTENEDGTVTAYFDAIIKKADYKYFDKVVVSFRDRAPVTYTDCKMSKIIIDGLHPSSDYSALFTVYSTTGGIKDYNIDFTTIPHSKDLQPTEEALNKELDDDGDLGLAGLEGMTW